MTAGIFVCRKEEKMNTYWPIALIVVSNIFYHVCSKSTPQAINPFAGLTVTYLVGACVSAVIYFITDRGGGVLVQLRQMNWTTFVLGLAIVGLEAGSVYMYKAGWAISTGQLVHSAILAICLIFVGRIFYGESLSLTKILGIAVCVVGLYLINRP